MKLKAKDLPKLREKLLVEQNNRCAICEILLDRPGDACLDHSHSSGYVRGVLCRNCNQAEGRVLSWANRAKRGGSTMEWLKAMIAYVAFHEMHPRSIIHPTHKTTEEKKALLKKRRARKKAGK